MIIGIFVIFLITLTTIKCIPCIENPNCNCSLLDHGKINVVCDSKNSTRFNIIIKSRNEVKIICKDWSGWENFYFMSSRIKSILENVSIEYCGLSESLTLKEVVTQLGASDTQILTFQAFRVINEPIERKQFHGFEYLKKLILSHNGLTKIPSDLFLDIPLLEHIDLSNNSLSLPSDIFHKNLKLKRINLFCSGLEEIHNGTFNNLTNLEYLNISSNHLHEIKAGTFDQLVSLKYLDLSRNYLVDLPSTLFHNLQNMEKLDISSNQFSSIPPNLFEKNEKLKELYVQYNELDTLSENLLSNLKELQHVYLNNNRLTFVPENLFWELIFLERIYLNDNSLITLSVKIFHGLKNVKYLSLKNNKLEIIPDNVFEYMENLEVLDLSNNFISRVSNDLFNGLGSLYEINMERNRINNVSREGFLSLKNLNIARLSHNPLKFNHTDHQLPLFHANQLLKELYLSNCSIKQFFDDWSTGNNDLMILDLSHNMIRNVSTSLFTLPSLEIIVDLSYNNITNLNLDQIEEMVSKSKEDRNTVIYMQHNPLLCDCSFYNILRYLGENMSKEVYDSYSITFGNLTCLNTDGIIDKDISNLNFINYKCSENEYFKTTERCQDGCTCSIRLSDKTRILDCSYRKKTEFVIDETKVNIPTNYSFIFNFTGNFLTDMPSIKTIYPINITSLLLSNNKISNVTLDGLPSSLQELELHNNNISIIKSKVVDYLKSLHWKKFTFSGNQILCDCDNHDLINFLLSIRDHHKDLKNLKCAHHNISMDEIAIDYMCQNSSKLTSILILLVVTAIIIGIIYFIVMRSVRRIRPLNEDYVVAYSDRRIGF